MPMVIHILVPPALLLIGVLLLWFASVRDLKPRISAPPGSSAAMRAAGMVLFVVGSVLWVLSVTLHLALIAIPVLLLVLAFTWRRYREAEYQSLLWGMLTAAERGIPLHAAAQALAAERRGSGGRRADYLADYLEAGVPLGLALRRSGYSVSGEVALAADLGHQTSSLGPALRQVLDRDHLLHTVTLPVATRLMYVGFVIVITLFVQLFLILRILPVLESLHESHAVPLPAISEQARHITDFGSPSSLGWIATCAIGIFGLVLGAIALLGSPRRLPVVRRLWWQVDCSFVLRWLATGVSQGRPILETLRLLAGYSPQARMRRALERAARRMEQGQHWSDCLVQSRVIRTRDKAVFQAAERAGNLDWALRQISDSTLRRWTYRLQMTMNFLLPLALVLVGGGVLVVILAFFLPLLDLIQGLT